MERYIETDWMSRWQELDAHNDDGIDGIVMLRKKRLVRLTSRSKLIGQPRNAESGSQGSFETLPIHGVVFVQVKGGEGYAGGSKKRPKHIEVKLGEEYIKDHRPRWRALSGPAIFVYVDTVNKKKNLDAWWTDLNSDDSYSN